MSLSAINPTLATTERVNVEKQQAESDKFEKALEKARISQDDQELKEACEQMEQYFLSMIFKQMKSSTEIGERLIPKGDYERIFEDYLIDEQCKEMTASGGIGLANMMYKQISQQNAAMPPQVDQKL